MQYLMGFRDTPWNTWASVVSEGHSPLTTVIVLSIAQSIISICTARRADQPVTKLDDMSGLDWRPYYEVFDVCPLQRALQHILIESWASRSLILGVHCDPDSWISDHEPGDSIRMTTEWYSCSPYYFDEHAHCKLWFSEAHCSCTNITVSLLSLPALDLVTDRRTCHIDTSYQLRYSSEGDTLPALVTVCTINIPLCNIPGTLIGCHESLMNFVSRQAWKMPCGMTSYAHFSGQRGK